MEPQQIFEDYSRDCYGEFSSDADGCARSKTVTKAKGEEIVEIQTQLKH